MALLAREAVQVSHLQLEPARLVALPESKLDFVRPPVLTPELVQPLVLVLELELVRPPESLMDSELEPV